MWPFKLKPRTPDQELADRVRAAVSEYNAAIDACRAAGLAVYCKTYHRYGFGATDDFISDNPIAVCWIRRSTTKVL